MPIVIHDRDLLLAELQKQQREPNGICSTCGLGPGSPLSGSPLPHWDCQRQLARLLSVELCDQCGFPLTTAAGLTAEGGAICQRCVMGGLKKAPAPINWDDKQ